MVLCSLVSMSLNARTSCVKASTVSRSMFSVLTMELEDKSPEVPSVFLMLPGILELLVDLYTPVFGIAAGAAAEKSNNSYKHVQTCRNIKPSPYQIANWPAFDCRF